MAQRRSNPSLSTRLFYAFFPNFQRCKPSRFGLLPTLIVGTIAVGMFVESLSSAAWLALTSPGAMVFGALVILVVGAMVAERKWPAKLVEQRTAVNTKTGRVKGERSVKHRYQAGTHAPINMTVDEWLEHDRRTAEAVKVKFTQPSEPVHHGPFPDDEIPF